MKTSTLISCLYGELRGYRRLRIRRLAAANERLDPADLGELTRSLFDAHLRRSLERFPFYAERVRAHRGSLPAPGESVAPEELPVWTRPDQRAFFDQLPTPPDSGFAHQTSGSTSLPIWFHVTRESYEWRTAVMDRNYSWAGAEEGRRSLHVWAADQTRPTRIHRVKRLVHLLLQRRAYVDAFRTIGERERAECVRMINRIRPEAIVGYAGMLADVAAFVRERPGVLKWKTPTMVSAAEGLAPAQRQLLESHLVGEVFASYGSREFMSVGMECDRHTGYHLASDNLLVEVVDDDGRPAAPGETGRIVITDFHNAANPFIRYEIGDLGVMAPPDERCPCGRPFPLLRSVEGRLQDAVLTPGGGKITALYVTYTMRQFPWIEGWQVIQDTPERMTVRLLTPAPLTPERTGPVTDVLRRQLGSDIEVDYERVDALIRRPNGKIALVMSSAEAERAVREG